MKIRFIHILIAGLIVVGTNTPSYATTNCVPGLLSISQDTANFWVNYWVPQCTGATCIVGQGSCTPCQITQNSSCSTGWQYTYY